MTVLIRSFVEHDTAREAVRGHISTNRNGTCRASILDGETLPDFVEALFERVEASMKRTVVEIEDIAKREQSEDPVMALDVDQHRLDRVTDESNDTQQDVHRALPIPTRIPRLILPDRTILRELRKSAAARTHIPTVVIRLAPTTRHELREVMGTSKPLILAALGLILRFVMSRAYHATSTPCSGWPAVG
jgi:hypothetical protein